MAFWVVTIVGFVVSTVSPAGLNSILESVFVFAAAVLVMAVLFIMASCLHHLFSNEYRGSHRWLWFILIFAGHIIGSTIYHFFVVLRKVNRS